jgi:predicted dehydrogenase
MEPVRWGVLGIGKHFVQRVLTPLLHSSLVQVAAVASREAARARTVAERFEIPSAYGSYEELLGDPAVEAVFIALPNHLHAEWVRRAADAAKHVLCEKPLAMDAGQAQASVDHCRRQGVRLMEAFMYRFHPQWTRARELVRCGEIGRVVAVHSLFTYHNTDPANIRNILKYGGGALPDIGCYAVSMPRFLFQAEPRRVIALIDRDPAFGTDVRTSGILDFGGGRALFTVSTQAFSSQRVEVLGTAGRMTFWVPLNAFPDAPARLTVTTGVGEREPQLAAVDQYGLEFEEFSRSLREDRPVPTPPEDAVANQRVLDALLASERSGRWEQL